LLGQTCHYPTYSAAVAAPTRARSLHDALPIYEEPVVIYHSHTATEAYPSRTDVDLASEPGAHYLLVSTRKPDTVEIRSFRIVDRSEEHTSELQPRENLVCRRPLEKKTPRTSPV